LKVALKVDSELFHVLTQIQDEVHRFAIEFHRNKRSKRALHSELDDIKGIGPKTRDGLLKGLKTVKQIRATSLEELTTIIGPSKAQIVYDYFHPARQ
jgi:excinuclease ABC subunit C